ncbi:hypothetical protein ACOSQ3_021655 [Xanthoceras sorbifolium]
MQTIGCFVNGFFVYICSCYSLLGPSEKFKFEARFPWNGAYQIISDDNKLQEPFHMFTEKKLLKLELMLSSYLLQQCPNQTFQLMLLTVKILWSQRIELLINQMKRILKLISSFPMLPPMATLEISLLRTVVKMRIDLAGCAYKFI